MAEDIKKMEVSGFTPRSGAMRSLIVVPERALEETAEKPETKPEKPAPQRKPKPAGRFFVNRAYADEESKKIASLMTKAAICAFICLAIFLLNISGTGFAKDLTETVREVVSYSLDVDDMLGRLKFVALGQNTAEVNSKPFFVMMPIDGLIEKKFDETGSGVQLKSQKGASVCAAADGIVLATGSAEGLGGYVKLRHENNYETVYYGLEDISVAAEKVVRKGESIGKAAGSSVLFEVRANGSPVDPLLHLTVSRGVTY